MWHIAQLKLLHSLFPPIPAGMPFSGTDMSRIGRVILILTFLRHATCDIALTSSDAQLKKPGETLKISCSVSGFSINDYWIYWVRQAPGKGLEWIGEINGGSTYYSESLKSHFTITGDSSRNTVSLQGTSLRTEDTAVYYCARLLPGRYYFDYWGKGTMVTVTSAAATAPTLFPLVPCGSGVSVDPVSVGCLATGFSPGSLTFGWSEGSKELTNFQKYPSVLGSGGLYSMTSQLSIPKADWENKDKMFYCKATNPSGTASAELKPPTPTPPPIPVHPTVYVVPPSAEDFKSDKTAKIICLAIGFSPLDVSFKWWNNQGLVTEGVESHGSVKDEKEKYSASSSLRVTEKEWRNPFNSFACEVHHTEGWSKLKNTSFIGECDPLTTDVTVTIQGPEAKEVFLQKRGTLTCIARGLADENEKTIAITWYKDNGKKPLASVTPTPELQYTDDGRIQATSRVIISKEEWSSNSTYKCVVAHPASFPSPKEETYRRDNGHVERTPSVFLLPPSSEQNSGIREELPLTCFIKDFYPKDVYVSWLADDVPVAESKFHTTSLIEEEAGKSYSVYSKLSVRTSDWNSGVFYTCVVHHESTPDSVPMITRTIDSSSGKPTLVNLNLKVPDTCRG